MGSIRAARRFFQGLPPDCPFAFVLALPARDEWLGLVARLLVQTNDAFRVLLDPPDALHPREVLLLSTHARRGPDAAEELSLDAVLSAVAGRYGRNSGVIVFSGIRAEGADGCRAILRQGGRVWTQDFQSCEFSNLPKYIHDHCHVSYSAAPEALALRVADPFPIFQRAATPRYQASPHTGPLS